MKTVYETGATSHAVNDLILFADNTRELAELRDKIYGRCARSASGLNFSIFFPLLNATQARYKQEFPEFDDHQHIWQLTPQQRTEFCQLYANDWENWKAEHGY